MTIIVDIYQDNILKFPLIDDEVILLSEIWEFLKLFEFNTYTLNEYRQNLIKNISSKFPLSKFNLYENIIEKLFWNLRWLVYPYFFNNEYSEKAYCKLINEEKIPNSLLEIQHDSYDKFDLYKDKLNESTSYRSFINKLLIIDDKTNNIYFKKQEGSSDIFFKNEFNLRTSSILFDRNLYEKIMLNPSLIKTIDLPKSYHEYDYAFPNLNFCASFIGSNKYRQKRIELMYYSNDSEKNWFKLIRP
jgi:hypothetical protein